MANDDSLGRNRPAGAQSAGRPCIERSTLINRNVTVAGHRTSIRLEPAMWEALNRVCTREDRSMNQLVTAIAGSREQSTLTAAIRVFLLSYYQAAATDEGHRRAGHGLVYRVAL
jgi:predicted DNA-binding ribbon-helix-helix protein